MLSLRHRALQRHQRQHDRHADGPCSTPCAMPPSAATSSRVSAPPHWRASRSRSSVVARGTYASDEYELPDSANNFLTSSMDLELSSNQQGTNNAPLPKQDWPKFVQFFRQASPYISGHRDRTFVIVIPGNVSPTPCMDGGPCMHACMDACCLRPLHPSRCPVSGPSSTPH